MTDLQLVRLKISDKTKFAFDAQDTDGETTIFKLAHVNIVASTFTLSLDNAEVASADYVLDADRGMVTFDTAPATGKSLESSYDYSVFTDDEINEFLVTAAYSVNQTVLELLEILLTDSARRFDYSSGQTEMKPSQVFKNLLDLRKVYRDKMQNGAMIAKRHSSYYSKEVTDESDLSRYE